MPTVATPTWRTWSHFHRFTMAQGTGNIQKLVGHVRATVLTTIFAVDSWGHKDGWSIDGNRVMSLGMVTSSVWAGALWLCLDQHCVTNLLRDQAHKAQWPCSGRRPEPPSYAQVKQFYAILRFLKSIFFQDSSQVSSNAAKMPNRKSDCHLSSCVRRGPNMRKVTSKALQLLLGCSRWHWR